MAKKGVQNMTVAANDIHRLHMTSKPGPNLPRQDESTLRNLAVASAWQLRMLDTPVHIARKCPVLPNFIPRTVGHGITVPTHDDASYKKAAPFHGDEVTPIDGIEGCPYYKPSS